MACSHGHKGCSYELKLNMWSSVHAEIGGTVPSTKPQEMVRKIKIKSTDGKEMPITSENDSGGMEDEAVTDSVNLGDHDREWTSPLDMPESSGKRDRRLAMNRITARARRKRKKEHLQVLELDVQNLKQRSVDLQLENQQLRDKISELTNMLQSFTTPPDTAVAVRASASLPSNILIQSPAVDYQTTIGNPSLLQQLALERDLQHQSSLLNQGAYLSRQSLLLQLQQQQQQQQQASLRSTVQHIYQGGIPIGGEAMFASLAQQTRSTGESNSSRMDDEDDAKISFLGNSATTRYDKSGR